MSNLNCESEISQTESINNQFPLDNGLLDLTSQNMLDSNLAKTSEHSVESLCNGTKPKTFLFPPRKQIKQRYVPGTIYQKFKEYNKWYTTVIPEEKQAEDRSEYDKMRETMVNELCEHMSKEKANRLFCKFLYNRAIRYFFHR